MEDTAARDSGGYLGTEASFGEFNPRD